MELESLRGSLCYMGELQSQVGWSHMEKEHWEAEDGVRLAAPKGAFPLEAVCRAGSHRSLEPEFVVFSC